MPMGSPGWPERAFSTASTARNRMVFAASVASAASVRAGAVTASPYTCRPPARDLGSMRIVPSRGAPVTPADAPLPELSLPELRRYGRHLTLPEVGEAGQRRLKAGRVLVVGAGGLGSPLALYLAAAGVGTIGVVDFDAVEEANLQRQIAHGTSALGRPKLARSTRRMKDLNPQVNVVPHAAYLDRSNALAIVGDYEVVVDGTDNFATRYLVNDACVLAGKPNVYGSILRFEGQASVFDAR